MIKKFINHIFPTYVNESAKKFSYTFYLGIFMIITVVMLFVTGFLLIFYYIPHPSFAYKSILFLEENVFIGKFLRSFHRMLTHFFLVFSALHLLRIVLSGIYKKRKYNYKVGYIMFLLIIFYAYTGYLLPFDQISYWATTTGMELFKQLPFGEKIVKILVPFSTEDKYTLLRFYILHVVILPVFLTFLISLHMYVLRKDKLIVQYNKKISLDVYKGFLLKISLSVIFLIGILSLLIKAPLQFPANFAIPPNPAKSAWFLLWIQEIVSIRGYLFNVLAVIFILYFFLPELSRRKTGYKWFAKDDRYVWIFTVAFSILIFVLTIIAYYFRGKNWEFVF